MYERIGERWDIPVYLIVWIQQRRSVIADSALCEAVAYWLLAQTDGETVVAGALR